MKTLHLILPIILVAGLAACSDDGSQNDNRNDAAQNGNNSNCTGPGGGLAYYAEGVEVDEASQVVVITGLYCPSAEVESCTPLPRSRITHRVSTAVTADGQMVATGPLSITSITAVTVEDCSAYPRLVDPEVCDLTAGWCHFDVPGFSRFDVRSGIHGAFCCGDIKYYNGLALVQPGDASEYVTEWDLRIGIGAGGVFQGPICGDGVCLEEEALDPYAGCRIDCGCGNGIIDGQFEECDGGNLNGAMCEDSTKVPECANCGIDHTSCN